jgi:hypothetical protein
MLMEMITQEDNARLVKYMRSYLKKVLDVLLPNKGKEALEYVLHQNFWIIWPDFTAKFRAVM